MDQEALIWLNCTEWARGDNDDEILEVIYSVRYSVLLAEKKNGDYIGKESSAVKRLTAIAKHPSLLACNEES